MLHTTPRKPAAAAGMPACYLEARFRVDAPVAIWPTEFAILSGYATTGEQWTAAQNEAADAELHAALEARGCWMTRLTGYSPDSHHTEPGWAAALPFDDACDVGVEFRQDAIYYVRGDALSVSFCDGRRALVAVGSFRKALQPPS